jgi:biliverdin reductase
VQIAVGLVGTGYAAKLRAESLQQDRRARLVMVAGQSLERSTAFGQTYGAEAALSWQELVQHPTLDLIVVSTINQEHGRIARAALKAGKHVVVEYPLSLDVVEAQELTALASAQNRLLHVEHIELLGGVHQALKANLGAIGAIFYSRYATIKPERPAPQKWTYHPDQFGFPLIGALSRLHRLVDLFGEVATISCQSRYWDTIGAGKLSPYYVACLCTAHLKFKSGVIAEVTYGKGETLWQAERRFEVQGEQGGLILDGEQGQLIQATGSYPLMVGGRRGLFAKDTTAVLDHLLTGTALYIQPQESAYTLKVADAARRSAETGQVVAVGNAG